MKALTEQLSAGDDRADMTPLIDCVFLLLLFFVVTAVFVEETNLFKIELAQAPHSQVREVKDATVVWVSKGGQFAMGQAYVPDNQLWDRLSELHRREPIKLLVIKGDRGSPLEKAVMAWDMALALDVGEIALAVERGK
jgi:biopolymer transport protein ExbD